MRLSTFFFANAISLVTASPLSSVGPKTLGLASWDLEGYAKDNPVGTTTGGKGGEDVYVSTAEDFLATVQGDEPRIIYVKGALELPERARVGSNKSILGVGWNAHIKKNGIDINSVNNVIVRNIKISYILDNDCIAIGNSTRVWIDHNEFESELSEEAGPDTYVRTDHPRERSRVLTDIMIGRPTGHCPRVRLGHRLMELLPRPLEVFPRRQQRRPARRRLWPPAHHLPPQLLEPLGHPRSRGALRPPARLQQPVRGLPVPGDPLALRQPGTGRGQRLPWGHERGAEHVWAGHSRG